MATDVYVSATLRMFAGHEPLLQAEGASVGEVLKSVAGEHEDIRRILFTDEGVLRDFVRVFVNDTEIRGLHGTETPVAPGDTVYLIPAVAGGAPAKNTPLIPAERSGAVEFTDRDLERYSGHFLLKEAGVKGQKRIRAARVLIAGLGPLGVETATVLASAGIGTLGLWDHRKTELPDLKNLIAFTERDLKRPRTAVIKDRIRNICRETAVSVFDYEVTSDNVQETVTGYDLVIDCTDNFKSRYLVNDACFFAGVPYVFASLYQTEGRVTVFKNDRSTQTPCLRCLFPAPPERNLVPTCSQTGIFSGVPSIIGGYAACEALKLITGAGRTLDGKLLSVDALNLTSHIFHVDRNCSCALCGETPTVRSVQAVDYDDFCNLREPDNTPPVESITVEELLRRIENHEPLTLVDVREPHERAVHRFRQAIPVPIGQLARRKGELNPAVDTIFLCKEGKRSILAINTLREASYTGPMYNLKGGLDAAKDMVFSNEAGWL